MRLAQHKVIGVGAYASGVRFSAVSRKLLFQDHVVRGLAQPRSGLTLRGQVGPHTTQVARVTSPIESSLRMTRAVKPEQSIQQAR